MKNQLLFAGLARVREALAKRKSVRGQAPRSMRYRFDVIGTNCRLPAVLDLESARAVPIHSSY